MDMMRPVAGINQVNDAPPRLLPDASTKRPYKFRGTYLG